MKNVADKTKLEEAYETVRGFMIRKDPEHDFKLDPEVEKNSSIVKLIRKHFPKHANSILRDHFIDLGAMNGWDDNVKEFYDAFHSLPDIKTVGWRTLDDGVYKIKYHVESYD